MCHCGLLSESFITFKILIIFYSNSVTVHITVVDINEYPPLFLDESYVKEVDEGRLYEEIVRVEAADRDCTPRFGDICKYDILNDDQPFTINNEGMLLLLLFFYV